MYYILLVLVIFLYILITWRTNKLFQLVPKQVFTYWSSENEIANKLVIKCIDTWRNHNPDWEIFVLNESNQHQYSNLVHNPKKQTIQHFSDTLRLDVLYQHGGVWLDATIWMTTSLNWIHKVQQDAKCSVVGFRNPIKPHTNIMENWFIACAPNNVFIQKWREEFSKAIHNVDHYLETVPRALWDQVENPNYLLQNVAWNVTYQRNYNLQADVCLLDSKNSVFKLHWDSNWDPVVFSKKFVNHKNNYKPFIKMTQRERSNVCDVIHEI
jgi:hypothetical protein